MIKQSKEEDSFHPIFLNVKLEEESNVISSSEALTPTYHETLLGTNCIMPTTPYLSPSKSSKPSLVFLVMTYPHHFLKIDFVQFSRRSKL